jgi:outer membrane receptor for ferrienterochelin and colicins
MCRSAALFLALCLGVPAGGRAQESTWLEGRVEAAGSGAPVAGATVRARGPAERTAVAGQDGAWRIGPLPAGAYTIVVEHIGYAPLERPLEMPRPGDLRVRLTARPLALDELVVTAGRRVQRLSETAVTTELVTRREIRQTGATDLASVLTERSGVELEGGHPVGAGVMIQGMGSERVLILLDGQPFIGRISGAIDLSRIPTSMIERVEIVKGPQSTLYGSEAMGGVVNVITRGVDGSAWTTAATATAGDAGRLDLAGNLVGGVGAVTGLVDVGRRAIELTPGWAGAGGAASERWDGLAKLGWKPPLAGVNLEASGLFLDERQRWRSGQLYHFADNTQWSARLGGAWERGAHRVAPTVYWTAFEHLSRSATGEDPVAGTGEHETQRLAEAELLYGVTAGPLSLDLGVEARRERIDSDRVDERIQTQETLEGFVQSTLTWRGWTVVPGVRASRSEPWGTHVTPRIAAMVRPVPELAVRLSAGEGFRAPSFKELHMRFLNVGPGFGYTVRGNPDLRPEVSRNLTAGAEWAGARTYLRLQGFVNHFDGFIETRPVSDSSGITVYTYGNVDDGRTRGGEVEVGAAWRGWQAEAAYSLLRAEHAETGDPLVGRPERSLRATLAFAHPGGLRMSVTGVHTGETAMRLSEAGTEWREPFTRFDARVARELPGGFEVVVGVDNGFDRQVEDWPGFTGRHLYTTVSWRAAGAGGERP